MKSLLTERDGIKRQGRLTRHLRWLSPSLIALAVIAVFGVAAPAAKADTLDFTITGTGTASTADLFFTLPSSPTPTASSPIAGLFMVSTGPYVVDFFNSGSIINSGGLSIGDGSSNLFVLASGAQLFDGGIDTPSFLINGLAPGGTVTYTLADGPDMGQVFGNYGDSTLGGYNSFNLSITDTSSPSVPTPEPSSLLLLGAGMIGLSGLIAYQQKKRGTVLVGQTAPSDGVVG